MNKRWIEGLIFLLGGFLGGLVLVALLAFGYLALYSQGVQATKDQYNRNATLDHLGPWPTPTWYPTVTEGPMYPSYLLTPAPPEPLSEEFAPIVAQAENYLTGGQPEKVTPLLNDWLNQIDSDTDTTKAYNLLAEAESAQGHYRIAASHYQRLFYSVPTAENLMKLARMCEVAGYLESSLNYYRLLLTYPVEQTGADNRVDAQSRIEAIKLVCPTCGQTPTPGQ